MQTTVNDKIRLTNHSCFCMHSEHCVYNSERKLTVLNILLITHGLLQMESNVCRVVDGVRL